LNFINFLQIKRITGRQDLSILIFKVIVVLGHTFLGSSLRMLIVMLIFIASMNIFAEYNKNSNYLDMTYSKILNI
jgi:hypothetical protein